MIAGEDRYRNPLKLWNLAPLPSCQPSRQFFEAAKTSGRFGKLLLPPGRQRGHVIVAARQFATECANVV
jgi:hypothetical protein